ncbi:MAG TPA: hypothetical protein VF228_03920 [Iamia sp.]
MSLPHRTRLALGPAVLVLAGAGLLACEPGARPEACNGAIGAVTVEDVTVPSGATCTLNGTRVQGNVTIARNGTLKAVRTTVGGNVQSQGHRLVTIREGSRVGGSVQLEAGGEVQVADSRVDGSVQLKSNTARSGVARTTVGSDVQLFSNRGALASHNRIDGNLQCKSNNPAPTGGGNVVQGNKEDQCARL